MLAAEFTKRLNQKTAESSAGLHVARSGAPKLDRRAADDDGATGTIGEKYHLRWHLLRESERVGGIRARGLQANAVATGDRSRHRLWRRRERTELRMLLRIVVDPSGQPADRTCADKPVQGDVYSPSASKIKKIRRHHDASPAPAPQGSEDSCIECFR